MRKAKIIAEVLLFLAMLAFILCACAGKKKVTETLVEHDTLVIVRTDTVINERVVRHVDTLRLESEKVITLKENDGRVDTVRIVVNNEHYKYIYVSDSTKAYKNAVDSVLKSLDKQHNKEVVKRTSYPLKWLIVGCVLFLLCLWILRQNTK